MTRSKIAKQVLALYRDFMVAARNKPGFSSRIREEFKRNAAIPLAESQRIEFLIRRGRRQLEGLKNPNTSSMQSFDPSARRKQSQLASNNIEPL
ncbi:hypothetical protein BV898_12440 [Hypsibius exemplaris]|uniref:Complex 1 LYR protein domain-containing protein n=1 Tax=Hypsibius exemplaris TaxID=2072580 RepID=A0A1W0WDQ3_HYPEX|nr:hypothetical protein BV898_12440 [Hypsibius exemplaris]